MLSRNILIIDDESSVVRTFIAYLNKHGYTAFGADSCESALDILSKHQVDVIFADIFLGEHSGIDFLKEIKTRGVKCPVVMITGEPDIETASASVRLGAFDYVTKPINKETFIRITKHAIQYKAFLDEKAVIENENERFRSHLEAIFMSVEDAIVTADNDMTIVRANSSLERICRMNQVAGERITDIKNKCGLKCWGVFGDALKTKNYIREYRINCEHALNPGQTVLLNVTPLKDREDRHIGGLMIVRDITRLSSLEEELQGKRQTYGIIGRNRVMKDIFKLIDSLKDMDTMVLVTGPSGTGKELVARAIHYCGPRADKPFITVNCSALAENLLETELFGHVKGAFTNAVQDKAGRFQLAEHGTIFLDEIGDISPKIQLKLLRVLETKEFERVGDSNPLKADVKIITATNQDLREKVKRGEFREDLYYRLKVVEIKMPPLKERRDDIPLLVEHYLAGFNQRFNKGIVCISKEVEELFLNYDWPGNIRELIHVLEHAFVVCRTQVIEIGHLPQEIREYLSKGCCVRRGYEGRVKNISREEITDALEKAGWNKARAARSLGISRPNLYKKMKDNNIRN